MASDLESAVDERNAFIRKRHAAAERSRPAACTLLSLITGRATLVQLSRLDERPEQARAAAISAAAATAALRYDIGEAEASR